VLHRFMFTLFYLVIITNLEQLKDLNLFFYYER